METWAALGLGYGGGEGKAGHGEIANANANDFNIETSPLKRQTYWRAVRNYPK